MNAFEDERPGWQTRPPERWRPPGRLTTAVLLAFGLGLVITVYNECKIDVGTGKQAVLIRKEGLELEPDMELAPLPKTAGAYYKGVQSGGPNNGVLTEGRYFYNPYLWTWEISPQFVVPGDKIGIRVAPQWRRHAPRPGPRRTGPERDSPRGLEAGSVSVQPLCRSD